MIRELNATFHEAIASYNIYVIITIPTNASYPKATTDGIKNKTKKTDAYLPTVSCDLVLV